MVDHSATNDSGNSNDKVVKALITKNHRFQFVLILFYLYALLYLQYIFLKKNDNYIQSENN